MALVFQALGVIAGGIALGALTGSRGRTSAGPALVAIGLCSVLFWTQLWPAIRAARHEREQHASFAHRDALEAGGANANRPFLAWARKAMQPEDTFALPGVDPGADAYVYQWSTYQLAPHRLAGAAQADWLVFYDVDPRRMRYDQRRYPHVRTFAPKFALAERDRAS